MHTQATKPKKDLRIILKPKNSDDPFVKKIAEYIQHETGGEIYTLLGSEKSKGIKICIRKIEKNKDEDSHERIVGEACQYAGMTPIKEFPLQFIDSLGRERYAQHKYYSGSRELEVWCNTY